MIMVLAPYLTDGHQAAEANDLDHTAVVSPRTIHQVTGSPFDGLIIVGSVRLTHAQARDLAAMFAEDRDDLADRIWDLT